MERQRFTILATLVGLALMALLLPSDAWPAAAASQPTSGPQKGIGLSSVGVSHIHTAKLAAADKDDGASEAASPFRENRNADGGLISGSGWINSPAGAYVADPTLAGRASFEFVARYRESADASAGQAEFQFRMASLNFHSVSYDWLVVAGAKATFQGCGTLNGNGDHGFMLSVMDGQRYGGGGLDRFRIRIWDKTIGDVVYDSQIAAADDVEPATLVEGGNIIVPSSSIMIRRRRSVAAEFLLPYNGLS